MNRRSFLALSAAPLAAQPAPIRTAVLGTKHSHTIGKVAAMRASPLYDVVGFHEPEPPATDAVKGLKILSEAEVLGDPSIRLVVVECSVWDAIALGRKVIAAGKHLHLEKPPGNDWRAFRELVEEARRKKLLLQTGYVWRTHVGLNAAIEAAKNGWLGEVFLVRGTMNSDRDAAQRAVEARYKGGTMFELGGHLVDRTVELLGRPKSVRSWLRHDSPVQDKLADNTMAVFEYDRAMVVLSSAAKMYGSADHRSFEILGSDGSAIVHPEANPPRLRIGLRKGQGPYRTGWQDVKLTPHVRFVADFEELGKAIQTGGSLRLGWDHELAVQETLLRASGELAG